MARLRLHWLGPLAVAACAPLPIGSDLGTPATGGSGVGGGDGSGGERVNTGGTAATSGGAGTGAAVSSGGAAAGGAASGSASAGGGDAGPSGATGGGGRAGGPSLGGSAEGGSHGGERPTEAGGAPTGGETPGSGGSGFAGSGFAAGAAGGPPTPGLGGATGAAGTAGAAGLGASSAGAAGAGSGGTPPSGCAPPSTAPITAMTVNGGSIVVGDFAGGVYCSFLPEPLTWRSCNNRGAPQYPEPLPARPVTALLQYSTGYALVAILPDLSTDVSIWQAGMVGNTPWNETVARGLVVEGMSLLPGTTDACLAVTADGVVNAPGCVASQFLLSGGPSGLTATAPVSEGLLRGQWLGTETGELYYVADPAQAASTLAWNAMDAGLAPAPVVGITPDPSDPERAYVTVASLDPTGLYTTTDGGRTFTPVALPVAPSSGPGALSAVSIDACAPNVLYLVAFTPAPVPLWSADFGRTWARQD